LLESGKDLIASELMRDTLARRELLLGEVNVAQEVEFLEEHFVPSGFHDDGCLLALLGQDKRFPGCTDLLDPSLCIRSKLGKGSHHGNQPPAEV